MVASYRSAARSAMLVRLGLAEDLLKKEAVSLPAKTQVAWARDETVGILARQDLVDMKHPPALALLQPLNSSHHGAHSTQKDRMPIGNRRGKKLQHRAI
jgi:hypothetical protein